jgi:hypothetical protein
MTTNYTKRPKNIPNGHKIYKIIYICTYIHFPFRGPPKYTKIGIFGLKLNHIWQPCLEGFNPTIVYVEA